MPISIKNERAEKLARDVAAISGENLTQTIIHALEERLMRLRGRRAPLAMADEIMTVSRRCRALPEVDPRHPDEILGYNDNGVTE
ncbi:MAG: type II toxin-antitoxin system VapB family antitoxin [Deltaproteobacteria bacterium]|nr:type II toxin-antitoxin system VapB family antitoxin [Deltaproteobacteria bacterium]